MFLSFWMKAKWPECLKHKYSKIRETFQAKKKFRRNNIWMKLVSVRPPKKTGTSPEKNERPPGVNLRKNWARVCVKWSSLASPRTATSTQTIPLLTSTASPWLSSRTAVTPRMKMTNHALKTRCQISKRHWRGKRLIWRCSRWWWRGRSIRRSVEGMTRSTCSHRRWKSRWRQRRGSRRKRVRLRK